MASELHDCADRSRGCARQPAGLTCRPQTHKELERELQRKEKALAETAALLFLSKKVAAIFHKGEDE